ncbi:hypothetical protein [Micropruina sp.]|uniref:hypothetical protein n=1 Tax=Micropruina sp. TaxID=2737536 RepID=UPI0039E4AAB9
MNGRLRYAFVAAALTVGLVAAGCAAPSATIAATGRVQTDTITVQAPALSVPRVNLNAGFVVTPGAAANLSGVPALLGFGSAQRVSSVEVRLGEQVKAGDVLVRFDDTALAADVTAARADRSVARAQVAVIEQAIATTHDNEADLADKRKEITKGIAKATKARYELAQKLAAASKAKTTVTGKLVEVNRVAKTLPKKLASVEQHLAEVTAKRAAVAQQLAQVEAQLAALPPDAPAVQREALLAAQRQLTAALAQLDTAVGTLTAARTQVRAAIAQVNVGRQQLKAALRQLNAGIPKLRTVIATIAANLAKANDGLKQLDKGMKKLRDARADLKRARTLAAIAADDRSALDQAVTARRQALVTAPRDGTITSVVSVGDVIAPGATVAAISSPAHVVALWLPPAQAGLVCVGDPATVAWGTNPSGTVSRILPLAQYPPSYQVTDDVHLTRAVPVEATFDQALSPGVPVDVQLSPCRTNEVKK